MARKQTSKVEFDYNDMANAKSVVEFLVSLPPTYPSMVIKTWDGMTSKTREIESIEYDSETNTVTIQ